MWYNKGASSTKIFTDVRQVVCHSVWVRDIGCSIHPHPKYKFYGVRGRVVECADLWSRNTNIAGSNPVGHPIVHTWAVKIKVCCRRRLT